jgi:hypothetical protein
MYICKCFAQNMTNSNFYGKNNTNLFDIVFNCPNILLTASHVIMVVIK